MNKKILIFVSKITEENDQLKKLITDFIGPDMQIVMETFANVTFEIEEGKVLIKVSGIDITTFNLIYIRSFPKSLSPTVGVLAYCLDRFGVKFINTRFRYSRSVSDKLTLITILSLAGFPTIPSYFCSRQKIEENANYIIQKFGFPIVVKETTKHHSKGVFVLREKADFTVMLSRQDIKKKDQFLFQKFIPLNSEYRLLVLGDSVKSVQQMYRDLSGFTSDIDYNRREDFVGVNAVSTEMKKMAVQSARTLDMQVAGVDIMLPKDGSGPRLIEVNSSPGFTFDTEISPEIPELSKYLKEEVMGK